MAEIIKKAQMNPYDLSSARRNAPALGQKVASSPRQPYALSSAQRLAKPAPMVRPARSY
ncbi:MAG TPA: hypothetical protein VKU01_27900 [Bryobacteraceae bacterium]|nr:hypothetical protein [Bryobacteraceae bacterium]